jgi:hypothetical protein
MKILIRTNENLINQIEESNCLAMTVKKDYKFIAFKNICIKAINGFNKISISLGTISFINFFL